MNDKQSQPPTSPLQERVLASIRSGKAAMRPRWHFVLKAILLGVGVCIVGLLLLFLASLSFWRFHEAQRLSVELVLLSIIFIVVLEVLVRRYAFAWRRPLLVSALLILVAALLFGFGLSRTRLHPGLYNYTQRHRLPGPGYLYRHFGPPRPPLHRVSPPPRLPFRNFPPSYL